MKRFYPRKLIFSAIVCICMPFYVQAADITSTAQGGKWDDEATWVGGNVPTPNDNVIITSTVTANGKSYSTKTYEMVNLTVQAGGKIIREEGNGGLAILQISGTLTNNGEIIDYDDYFDIHLLGDLVNNGVMKPRSITLEGSNQYISGTKAIECTDFNLDMTDDEATAASNLIFNNCIVSSTASKILNMKSFNLTVMADSIDYDSYYGAVYTDGEIRSPILFSGTGTVKLDNAILGGTITGNVVLKSSTYAFVNDLVVNGNFSIEEGTRVSCYKSLKTIKIRGKLSNYGEIEKDSVVQGDLKFPPRTMYFYVSGDITNFGSTGITKIYAVTNGKTITLSGDFAGDVTLLQSENDSETPGGKVLIKDEVSISGGLDVYADLEISKGGTLNMLSKTKSNPLYLKSSLAKLINNGTINRYHPVNNNWSDRSFEDQPGMSINYELRSWDGQIDGVNVTVHNQETYPGLPGSTKRWWHLEPVGDGNVTGYILKLFYDESQLNGQQEENLRVFRSGDAGKTWELVSVGNYAVLDTAENSITIGVWSDSNSMLHDFGDFVISSGDGSVPIPSNIVVNLTGSPNVRLGAPTRYTMHLYNGGNTRSDAFMAAITVTDDIAFRQVELPGDSGKTVLPIDSIGTPQDHTELFYVPYLEPDEEYAFDIIVMGVNAGTKSAQTSTMLTVTGLGKFGANDKLGDYVAEKVNKYVDLNEQEAQEYAQGMGITVKQLEMKKEKEGAGAFALKTVIKYGVENASKLHPATNLVYKIGSAIETVAKFKDSFRRRIWHWLYKETGLYGVDEPEVMSGKNMEGKIVTSWDPNEKLGPTGYGSSNFISHAGRMDYTIQFENKKEATAPAYRVQIVDTLAEVFDPETVKFGVTSHSGPNYNWKMNRNGNILKWDIEGIELPPNVTPPEGEGFVTFSVEMKSGLPSGTEIANRATVIFDINPPIITNTWTNVLDTIPPQIKMNQIAYANGDSLINLSCTADDGENGSGVNKYSFYVSVNDEPFSLIGDGFENSVSYPVSTTEKNTYRFYALATDNVDNTQSSIPEIVELKSLSVKANFPKHTDRFRVFPNPVISSVNISFYSTSHSNALFELFSVTGERIARKNLGIFGPGEHQVRTDISTVPRGVYFVHLKLNQKIHTRKIVKD